MAITPLCTKFSAVQMKTATRRRKYDSAVVFASALKPLDAALARRCIRFPVQTERQKLMLKVPKFKYAPTTRLLGPVSFKDIPQTKPAAKQQVLQPLDHEQETHHILAQPEFLEALEKRNSRKSMRHKHHRHPNVVHRRHSQPFDPVEFDRPNRQVKRRSIPFNESTETDPFMLFHDLQTPHSAMKSDSAAYIKQMEEVAAAKEQRYRARRGSPLKPEEIKDLIHMTLNMGIYASPTKRSTTPSRSTNVKSFSLMDID